MKTPSRVPWVCLVPAALCLVTLVTVAAAPGRQAAGVIRGRVRVADRVPAMLDHRPAVADLGASVLHEARDPLEERRAVVYLESAPRQAFAELQPGRARLNQRGEQFIPHVLAITVGTTVDFPNHDAEFHNVFSLSKTKTFNLGSYPQGQSRAVTFDKPGIVPVSCDIHRHMSAYILVFSHPFFAVTEDDGRYTIADVPAGTYTLMLWSELGKSEPRVITVVSGGATDVDFQIGRGQS
jgi:plastocyanin